MGLAIALTLAGVAVYWFSSWRVDSSRPISSAEFNDRLRRQRLGLKSVEWISEMHRSKMPPHSRRKFRKGASPMK
jgi:hypothetical protein